MFKGLYHAYLAKRNEMLWRDVILVQTSTIVSH